MFLGPRRILPSTGVSNGRGMAFWLTDAPTAVVKVKVAEEDARLLGIPHDWIHPSSCLQLGRLSEACIGLVAASAVNVAVFRLALDEYWFRHGFLNVVRREEEAGEVRVEMAVVCPEPQERPGVMRFERDVTMWIDGRMVVLEIDWENRSTAVHQVHEMPAWKRGPETVWDAVPYVCMEMEADDFPVTEFEDMEYSGDDA